MEVKDILPLGSVVSLKSGLWLIIIGIFQEGQENKGIYDYCGLIYPFGYINSENVMLFNRDEIEKVIFMGYSDERLIEFYEDSVWNQEMLKGENKNG